MAVTYLFLFSITSTSSPPSPPHDPLYSTIFPALNLVFLPCNSSRLRLPQLMVCFFCIVLLFYDPLINDILLTRSCYSPHCLPKKLLLRWGHTVTVTFLPIMDRPTPAPLLIYPLPTYQLLQSYWLTKQCRSLKLPTIC